jgi:hypothetical protein
MFVTSGNRCIAARLSSVVRCVYWRETAALSCPTISRAIKSEAPGCFQHRHRTVTQTVERNLARLARVVAAFAGTFVSARSRLNKSSGNENIPELIRQRRRALRARGVRQDESVWVVASWQCRLIAQRLQKRQDDSPSGRARGKRDLASFEVDCPPFLP